MKVFKKFKILFIKVFECIELYYLFMLFDYIVKNRCLFLVNVIFLVIGIVCIFGLLGCGKLFLF